MEKLKMILALFKGKKKKNNNPSFNNDVMPAADVPSPMTSLQGAVFGQNRDEEVEVPSASMSSDNVKKVFFADRKKALPVLGIVLAGVCFGGTYLFLLQEDEPAGGLVQNTPVNVKEASSDKPKPDMPKVPESQASNPGAQMIMNGGIMAANNVANGVIPNAVPVPGMASDLGPLARNPFVFLKDFRDQIVDEKIAAGENVPGRLAANRGFPSIPQSSFSVPAPSVPPVPSTRKGINRGMMGANTNAAAAAPAKPEITGISTGEDGNAIAIMNNGEVVSTGETFNDGRIAWINDSGIGFENGNVMEYK